MCEGSTTTPNDSIKVTRQFPRLRTLQSLYHSHHTPSAIRFLAKSLTFEGTQDHSVSHLFASPQWRSIEFYFKPPNRAVTLPPPAHSPLLLGPPRIIQFCNRNHSRLPPSHTTPLGRAFCQSICVMYGVFSCPPSSCQNGTDDPPTIVLVATCQTTTAELRTLRSIHY